VEVHQPGHTHYETDAGEGCPVWHFERVPCTCNRIAELERERDALRALLRRFWESEVPISAELEAEICAALEQPAAQSSERAE
jgi:hypothetical protein